MNSDSDRILRATLTKPDEPRNYVYNPATGLPPGEHDKHAIPGDAEFDAIGWLLACVVALLVCLWCLWCLGCDYRREIRPAVVSAVWTDLGTGSRDGIVELCATVSATQYTRRDFCGPTDSTAARLHDLGAGARVEVVLAYSPGGTPYIESVRYSRGQL